MMQSFTDALRISMLNQLMASLDSSGSDKLLNGLGNQAGNSSGLSMAMMTSMMSLYEQMLSLQVQTGTSPTTLDTTNTASPVNALSKNETSNVHHINQFTAELQVGGNGANANCGPTALVMALHQLGIRVAGETAGTNDGQAVDLARRSMAASSAKDGVDANGKRVDREHSTWTNFRELARGAAAAGAKSESITADAAGIQSALKSGASVIVSGTFAGKSPLPWTGDRGKDNNSAPGGATGHFVEVSSYDPATNTFLINDPARNQAHRVNAANLERFMSGNAGAMAIWNQNAGPLKLANL
jgi:hypothetical protein